MRRHARFLYHPAIPLGKNGKFITGCPAHQKVAKDAAIEGTVLLKNNGVLPLQTGAKICLFGIGAGRDPGFLFGGGGSGVVHTSHRISLADSLDAAAKNGEIAFFSQLADYYTVELQKEQEEAKKLSEEDYAKWKCGQFRRIPVLPEDLYQQAKEFGDTAIFCLSRFSTENTYYGDRIGGKGDYYLLDEEAQLLDRLTQDFSKVIVILNVCGPVSTQEYAENDKIDAVLYPLFGGGASGDALTEILLGKRYPSGHLQDTLAREITDYPSTASFRESDDFVNYTEDIFVGYRYFETFAPEKVVYPYGFGLSYTTFQIATQAAALEKNTVKLSVRVKNSGCFSGKEVVQAYLTAPQGKLGKAAKVLCAFGKTKELKPGEETVVALSFDIREFGSFDDLGKVAESAFVLEAGEYTVSVGNNVRDTAAALTFTLAEDIICRRCHSYMAPTLLKVRLCADGSMEQLPEAPVHSHPAKTYRLRSEAADPQISLVQAFEEDRLDAFLAGLSDEDLAEIVYGHPNPNTANTNSIGLFLKEKRDVKKVPLIPTADGPAGLRFFEDCGINTTYLPCANTVSQTWDLSFAKKLGSIGALEAKENNVGIWLTPAMNIHRNPLCGRNFEYFSEDPLIAGLFAASSVQGIQSQNIAATVKHFCCNNKEVNRKESDSRVSQRALREIYLRGFEIVIKKGRPWALMTSYNKVNGVRSSANWEAINGILRGEWKYDGLVMTDWWVFSTIEEELLAGSDVKMPEHITLTAPNPPAPYSLAQRIHSGELDRKVVQTAARRVLRLMGYLD